MPSKPKLMLSKCDRSLEKSPVSISFQSNIVPNRGGYSPSRAVTSFALVHESARADVVPKKIDSAILIRARFFLIVIFCHFLQLNLAAIKLLRCDVFALLPHQTVPPVGRGLMLTARLIKAFLPSRLIVSCFSMLTNLPCHMRTCTMDNIGMVGGWRKAFGSL